MRSLATLIAVLPLFGTAIVAADERTAASQSAPPHYAARAATIKRVSTRSSAKPEKVSCEDLMAFDQASRPQAVYFVQGRIRCELRSR